jgi:hypothetical protein
MLTNGAEPERVGGTLPKEYNYFHRPLPWAEISCAFSPSGTNHFVIINSNNP